MEPTSFNSSIDAYRPLTRSRRILPEHRKPSNSRVKTKPEAAIAEVQPPNQTHRARNDLPPRPVIPRKITAHGQHRPSRPRMTTANSQSRSRLNIHRPPGSQTNMPVDRATILVHSRDIPTKRTDDMGQNELYNTPRTSVTSTARWRPAN